MNDILNAKKTTENIRAMYGSFPAGYAASRGLTNAQMQSFGEDMLRGYQAYRQAQM